MSCWKCHSASLSVTSSSVNFGSQCFARPSTRSMCGLRGPAIPLEVLHALSTSQDVMVTPSSTTTHHFLSSVVEFFPRRCQASASARSCSPSDPMIVIGSSFFRPQSIVPTRLTETHKVSFLFPNFQNMPQLLESALCGCSCLCAEDQQTLQDPYQE